MLSQPRSFGLSSVFRKQIRKLEMSQRCDTLDSQNLRKCVKTPKTQNSKWCTSADWFRYYIGEAPRGMEPYFIFAILPIALALILDTLGVEQETSNRVHAAVILFGAHKNMFLWTFCWLIQILFAASSRSNDSFWPNANHVGSRILRLVIINVNQLWRAVKIPLQSWILILALYSKPFFNTRYLHESSVKKCSEIWLENPFHFDELSS